MIKISVNARGRASVEYAGSPVEIEVELAAAIGSIYQEIGSRNILSAMEFRRVIQTALNDDAPTWQMPKDATTITIDKETMRNE